MQKLRILLAEDDIDDRDFFCEFLGRREDIIIHTPVENGEDILTTLTTLTADEVDVIILDQNMPKLNGYQTLEHLKSNENYCKKPVIIYTSYATPELRKVCIKAGASAVLQKPVSEQEYNEMIDHIVALFNA